METSESSEHNPKLLGGFLWSESRARTRQRSVDGSRCALFDPTLLQVQLVNNAQVHPNPQHCCDSWRHTGAVAPSAMSTTSTVLPNALIPAGSHEATHHAVCLHSSASLQLINTVFKAGRIPASLGKPRNAKRGTREQLPVCLVRSPQARLQASLAVAHRKSGV